VNPEDEKTDNQSILRLIGAGGDIYKDYDFAKDCEDAWAR
jgi:hypothetical protein